RRASVLTYRQLDRPFAEQVRTVKRLYDRRSKYVHEGQPTDQRILDEVEQVCVEILWSLLVTSASDEVKSISDWVRLIDYVASALAAGKEVPESEFKVIGVPPVGTKRVPPNRVRSSPTPPPPFMPSDLWKRRIGGSPE